MYYGGSVNRFCLIFHLLAALIAVIYLPLVPTGWDPKIQKTELLHTHVSSVILNYFNFRECFACGMTYARGAVSSGKGEWGNYNADGIKSFWFMNVQNRNHRLQGWWCRTRPDELRYIMAHSPLSICVQSTYSLGITVSSHIQIAYFICLKSRNAFLI